MEAYKDTDLMPYGKHKGVKLANVPASYLQWLFENALQGAPNKMTIENKKLRKYYEENKEVIQKELKKR